MNFYIIKKVVETDNMKAKIGDIELEGSPAEVLGLVTDILNNKVSALNKFTKRTRKGHSAKTKRKMRLSALKRWNKKRA